jgi:hypothetical protein
MTLMASYEVPRIANTASKSIIYPFANMAAQVLHNVLFAPRLCQQRRARRYEIPHGKSSRTNQKRSGEPRVYAPFFAFV